MDLTVYKTSGPGGLGVPESWDTGGPWGLDGPVGLKSPRDPIGLGGPGVPGLGPTFPP